MTISIWLETTRPKTLIASICPILIASAFSYSMGGFSILTFISILVTGLSLQIGTNFANDLYDFLKGTDTPDRIGPRRSCQSGLISIKEMKIATSLAFLTATLSSLYLMQIGGPLILCMLILGITLGLGYTTGPFPLSYLGLADIVVFIFFGPIATLLTTHLLTNTLTIKALLLGVGPGALCSNLLTFNNLRDIPTDRVANKKTLPVRFGESFGKGQIYLNLILSILTPLIILNSYLFILPLLLLASRIIIKTHRAKEPLDYLHLLPLGAKHLLLYTILITCSILLR